MPRVKIYFPKSDSAPEVRRWQINSYSELCQKVAEILGIPSQLGKLEYLDDDQDWVILSDASEWNEAVLTLGESKEVLQLRFSPPQRRTASSAPMQAQRKSSSAQAQGQQQSHSFHGSQRAIVNLEDYLKGLHADQQLQNQFQQRASTPQQQYAMSSPVQLQQMSRRPSDVSSQEIAPPSPQPALLLRGSPLVRSPLTRQQGGAQQQRQQQKPAQQQQEHHETIHIPFEDFLKQFGGKLLNLVHPSHEQNEEQQQKRQSAQQQQQRAATPKSALPGQSTQAAFQQPQSKARSQSDSGFANMIPRIILHPSTMIGNARAVPPQRSILTTTAPSDLPLSKDEASTPRNMENIHKEERDEFAQMEARAQTPKELSPLPPKAREESEDKERFFQDPHLEDLTSEEMDSMLDEVLDQDEANEAQQQQEAVAPQAVKNSGPVQVSNLDTQILARNQASSPFLPTAPEGTEGSKYTIQEGGNSANQQQSQQAQQQEEDSDSDAQQFQHTMQLLENIGFDNRKLNLHLLKFHKGNVNDTIHALLKLSQQDAENGEH